MKSEAFWRRLADWGERPALVSAAGTPSYGELSTTIDAWRFDRFGLAEPCVVALRSDFSAVSISLLLALLKRGFVVALLPDAVDYSYHLSHAGAAGCFEVADGEVAWRPAAGVATPPRLAADLLAAGSGGMIICSSGSTGLPKIILHGLDRFLAKFTGDEPAAVMLAFFLLDHVAGLDRLFLALVSGSTLAVPERRDAAAVCRLVAECGVELMSVSPSFINLLLLSGEYSRHDLSSLRRVTYGSEPMSEAGLARLGELFPAAELQQTYGTSELGSLRVESRARDSLWLRPAADYFQWQQRDGALWIRSATAMLGYLHTAEPAFDADGWYCTGDEVDVDGEWIRIVGRLSDVIIVGGEKVYPSEVESVIEAYGDVVACLVKGEENPILGNMVTAIVETAPGVDFKVLQKALRSHCRAQLAPYKVPMKFVAADAPLVTARSKKRRA